MFRQKEAANATSISVPIMVIDSTDGTPETGYTDASSGIDFWYRRAGGSRVAIVEAALAAWNSAYSSGGVEHGSDGRGRLDLPDAALIAGAPYVEYGGTITGMIVIGGVVELSVATSISGTFLGTHSSTTADLGANAPTNDVTGMTLFNPTDNESRIVTAYNTGTGIATFAAWDTGAGVTDGEPWVLLPSAPIDTVTLAAINAEAVAAVKTAMGVVTSTVAVDAGNDADSFEVVATAGTVERMGMMKFTSDNLDTEGRLVRWIGTSVVVVALTSVPSGLEEVSAFSAEPDEGASFEFWPIG